MRALSIAQPWAYCITHGTKRVENRSWPTSFRGRFLVHAGKKRQRGVEVEIHLDSPEVDVEAMRIAPTGAIVGAATIVDCVTPSYVSADQRIWAGGPWCFILEDVVALDEPIPYRGKLGFFEIPDEIVYGALGATTNTSRCPSARTIARGANGADGISAAPQRRVASDAIAHSHMKRST